MARNSLGLVSDATAGERSAARAVERRPLAALRESPNNSRVHPDHQVEQIAESIRAYGFTNPILVDEENTILAGHGRASAARRLGLADVPVIVARGWSEAERRAYVIADNKIAQNATWAEDLLAAEIGALREGGHDHLVIGFSAEELDALLAEPEPLKVAEVETTTVADTFWISVRGPIERQAEALRLVAEGLRALPDLEVEIGTTAVAL